MNPVEDNQTLFSSNEPILQDPVTLPEDPEKKIERLKQEKKKKHMLLAGVGGFLFFIILIMAAAMTQQRMPGSIIVPTPTPKAEEKITSTEIQTAVRDVQQVVKDADPSISEYPFPPVSFEITIKEGEFQPIQQE